MSDCEVCGRERFVKGGVLPPEQPDDAKHCLAWFSHRDGEDCYRRGYSRLTLARVEAERERNEARQTAAGSMAQFNSAEECARKHAERADAAQTRYELMEALQVATRKKHEASEQAQQRMREALEAVLEYLEAISRLAVELGSQKLGAPVALTTIGCHANVLLADTRAALGAEPGDAALTQKEGQGAPAARTTPAVGGRE